VRNAPGRKRWLRALRLDLTDLVRELMKYEYRDIRRIFLTLIIALVANGAVFAGESIQAKHKQALYQLFDQEWQARKDRFPGFDGSDNKEGDLTDVSEAAQMKWLSLTNDFLLRLSKIDSTSLSDDDKINYQIFKQQLVNRQQNLIFKDYQIPFLADSGFHTQIDRMPVETEFKTLEDYQSYLKRLSNIPLFFSQNKENMNAGLARNFSMPSVVMQGFTEVIRRQLVDQPKSSGFYRPFIKLPKDIDLNVQRSLRKQALAVIKDDVIPAYESLAEYFDDVYIPNTKMSLGASDFPNGEAYYQHKIKQYTTVDLSPEMIHQIGLDEVKRIRAEMESIIKSLKYSGDFKTFLKFLRESEQFYAKTPKELLKEAAYIAKKMDGQLPRFFTKLPRQPYTVEPVPDAIAPKYTTGRYVSAPLTSTRAGTYWVNTYALDKRPLYVLESLTLHEAVPGHHLQGALNQELANLPKFRRYSYISAFGEGWALYCEKLGLEAGFYQDPYSDFGRLSYEMWRAARLVIDTGIHSFGWSRQQAIDLLEQNSALSKHNIRTEVDRYISWPGQALSYKLGEIKILQLRQLAEQQLGSKFDIRLFHDAILENGSIPLNVLERQMKNFIQKQNAHK
jgi:uncharacterized protein (DUF885 family)